MKWVWGCKQEYVHLLVQARGVRFPTSRLLWMNGRTPCWECFAKKTAVKPLLRRHNQRCLPFAQSHGFEVNWSERKTSAWRHCGPTWYARPRGYKDGMWQVGLQSVNTRRRNERPRCKDSCSISQILPRVCTTHLLNSTSSPDFTPHLFDTFVELTCRTRFQPLSKYVHLYEGFGERFVERLWHSTFCKTLLNNTSAKSLRRLSLRLGSVNKTTSYTLYG